MAVIKVKSTHEETQGPFVLLDDYDFKEGVHELYIPPPPEYVAPPPPPPPPGLVDPLDNLPADWREQDNVRAVAFAVTGRAVENKEQAIAVIEAALLAK